MGRQKRVMLKQIQGWNDDETSNLSDRLDAMDVGITYVQTTPSVNWGVTHNLNNLRPSVTLIDNDGNTLIGDINYVTENYLEVNFDVAITGQAIIKN